MRLGLLPNQRRAWYWAYLVGEGRPLWPCATTTSRFPRWPWRFDRGLWAELICETPHDHWSRELEAFGVALDDPADAYRLSEATGLRSGSTWSGRATGDVFPYPGTTRYEQACGSAARCWSGDERLGFERLGRA